MEKYKAIQLEAPPNLQFLGVYLLGFYTHVNEDITEHILTDYGLSLEDIEPYDSYEANVYFSIMQDIAAMPGGHMTLIAIGQAIGATLVEHHNLMTPDDLIASFVSGDYHSGVENAPLGYGFDITHIAEHSYQVVNNTPFPNSIVFGLLHESLRILAVDTNSVQQITDLDGTSLEGAQFEVSW